MTQQSGAPKIVNLSGGLYRSATPTQIPQISMSDMKNFDIEDNALTTRKGLTQSNSSSFYPGTLQFGFSQAQRVHFLKTTGGDFGPQRPASTTQSKWGMYFYSKEATAVTTRRTIATFEDESGSPLIEIGWDTSNRLQCRLRTSTTESWAVVNAGAGGETVSRTSTTAYLYGVSFTTDDTAPSVEVTLWDFSGNKVVDNATGFSSVQWRTCENLILGCDTNTTYPSTDWTNSANTALYGYIGEVVIVRNSPTDITGAFNDMKTQPGARVPADQRVAYYPLSKDFSDEWGLSSDFGSNTFKTGGGLSNYSVKDTLVYTATSESRDVLHCTKSWHVDTYDVDDHLIAKTSSLNNLTRGYMNGVNKAYTLTFDVLPVKTGSGTYTLLEATTSGPYIKLSKRNAGKTQIEYGHKFDTVDSTSITHSVDNNFVSKISCQYASSGATSTTHSLRIFEDTARVSSTIANLTSITSDSVGNLQLGTSDVTSISSDFFVSGLVLHNTNAGDNWGAKPQERMENITTYKTVVTQVRESYTYNVGGSLGNALREGSEQIVTGSRLVSQSSQVKDGSKIERTGGDIGSFSIFDLPKYSNVKAGYLFTETTGYDSATGSSPHGIFPNIFTTSSTDGSDLLLLNSNAPVWVADRNSVGLDTTGYLDGHYEADADNVLAYTPVNTNLKSRIFLTRNAQLVDTNANSFQLGDTYKATDRRSGKTRGFMYGNSLYFHNQNYYLRFNGNEIRPVEVITPSIPISLSKDSSPGTGLNGTYKYTYTYVDKSGIESYPALPQSTTVSTGNVAVSLDTRIAAQSYLSDQIEYVNFYRNKGGTTSTTNFGRDADKSLYLVKRLPIEAIRKSGTLFTDTTADAALGKNPPQPDYADPIPPCRYSTIFRDTVLFTGDDRAPNHFYQSVGQTPELMALPGFGEFQTENGEKNVGIAAVGAGFIVFKNNSRLFVRNGIGGEKYEYHNGGCMAHDSLVTIGQRVVGLGPNGFFVTDGHQYDDITSVRSDGRTVSSIHLDVDTWTDAIKSAATATYHSPTERYICHVNSKYYVFDFRWKVWTKYEDMVGLPFVYNNDLYIYKKGWLNKEVSTQSYVGSTVFKHSIASGAPGKVQIVSTTAPPTSNVYGLPCYVNTTFYWMTSISKTGTTSDILLDTNTNFTNKTDFSVGVMNHFADTKYFQMRTPHRNKMFKRFLMEHDNTTDGEIKIRLARNSGTFDRGSNHYVADTDIEKVNTVLRVRSDNMSVEMAVEDGKSHTIRGYEVVYDQDSVK